jgi:hypothetical protein
MTLDYGKVFLGKGTELGIQTGLGLALKERDPHDVICCLLLQVRNVEYRPCHGLHDVNCP